MKTITKTFTVRTFDELTPEEQAKALDKARYYDVETLDWSQSTIDDFTAIMEDIGLDVENVFFSGFSSQSDGASFAGSYRFTPDGLENFRANTAAPDLIPLMEEIHALGSAGAARDGNEGEFSVIITKWRGRYCHENTMEFEFHQEPKDKTPWIIAFRKLAKWVYAQLETEYKWLTSDEGIAESFRSNEVVWETEKKE